ncbi:MAG: hypothetical protein ABI411_16000 [Tahibacter sp.]
MIRITRSVHDDATASRLIIDGARDLDSHLRDLDTASVPNLDVTRDPGAYERQLRDCGAADTVFCNSFHFG